MISVETERDTMRLRCDCGARASMRAGAELLAELERWWREYHADCRTRTRREQIRDAYRRRVGGSVRRHLCTRCDGEGHNARSCPLPPDDADVQPALFGAP